MFSSPIGESIFSTHNKGRIKIEVGGSRPLSGNLFSLHYSFPSFYHCKNQFSSPIGESIFSTPFSQSQRNILTVLVPYRGIYFLYSSQKSATLSGLKSFSSPIGESIFSTQKNYICHSGLRCSRPLSGNLFSLLSSADRCPPSSYVLVPYRGIYFLYLYLFLWFRFFLPVLVPYRGIYFLYRDNTANETTVRVFSSPIGESIFSTSMKGYYTSYGYMFSSPIGESIFSTFSFLIITKPLSSVLVPYRGIYFLYESV